MHCNNESLPWVINPSESQRIENHVSWALRNYTADGICTFGHRLHIHLLKQMRDQNSGEMKLPGQFTVKNPFPGKMWSNPSLKGLEVGVFPFQEFPCTVNATGYAIGR